jgi:hypothetical protein
LSNDRISARVESFVRELEALVNAHALAAVRAAFGNAPIARPAAGAPAAARTGRKRSRGATKTAAPAASKPSPKGAATKKPAAARKGAAKASGPLPADEKIVAHLKQHPGTRLEPLATALGVPSPRLKARVAELVASKVLRKQGKTRGTTYFVA